MDRNISYDKALETVDTSAKFNDLQTLRITLQRFPVLQLRAGRNLLSKIYLNGPGNVSEKSRVVRATADAIGCVVSPSDLVTAECKLCATNLFYGIRDLNQVFLQALVRRMVLAKLQCGGCGLFVHVALSETLQHLGKLPNYVKNLFRVDYSENEAVKQSWKEVLDVLKKEGVLPGADQVSSPHVWEPFNAHHENVRRLRLRKELSKLVRKRRKRRLSSRPYTTSGGLNSRVEAQQIFKLLTMYAACPRFVSDKIQAHALRSYCSSKALSISAALKRPTLRRLTDDEVSFIGVIGRTKFDPSPQLALRYHEMGLSKAAELENADTAMENTFHDSITNPTRSLYDVWMPIGLGCQRLLQKLHQGQANIADVLKMWNAAEGKFISSMDRIIISTMANGRVMEELLSSCLVIGLDASPSEVTNFASNTSDLLGWQTIGDCFHMIDCVTERGSRYEKSFWEQLGTVCTKLEGAFLLLVLRRVEKASKANASAIMDMRRRIEERLQGYVQYKRAKPRSNAAVLKVCDCLSVEMTWKHKRRLKSSVWSSCPCMIRNTMLVPVPQPDLWFSWRVKTMSSDTWESSCAQEVHKHGFISRWLYANRAWRTRQYNFCKIEIFRGVVKGMLRHGVAELSSEIQDILAHVSEDPDVQRTILSEFAKCSEQVILEVDAESEEKSSETELQLIRRGIENIWCAMGHQSRVSLLSVASLRPLEELKEIEVFLATVVPDQKGIHGCIHDMPTLCEYISVRCRALTAQHKMNNYGCMRVTIVEGLMRSQFGTKDLLAGVDENQREINRLHESVMLCFEQALHCQN